MTIYSGFVHEKWWFSIAMLVYQRVWNTRMSSQCSEDRYGRLWTLLDQGKCRAVLILRSSYWSLYMRYHKLLKIMRSGLAQVVTCIQQIRRQRCAAPWSIMKEPCHLPFLPSLRMCLCERKKSPSMGCVIMDPQSIQLDPTWQVVNFSWSEGYPCPPKHQCSPLGNLSWWNVLDLVIFLGVRSTVVVQAMGSDFIHWMNNIYSRFLYG